MQGPTRHWPRPSSGQGVVTPAQRAERSLAGRSRPARLSCLQRSADPGPSSNLPAQCSSPRAWSLLESVQRLALEARARRSHPVPAPQLAPVPMPRREAWARPAHWSRPGRRSGRSRPARLSCLQRSADQAPSSRLPAPCSSPRARSLLAPVPTQTIAARLARRAGRLHPAQDRFVQPSLDCYLLSNSPLPRPPPQKMHYPGPCPSSGPRHRERNSLPLAPPQAALRSAAAHWFVPA